MEYTCTVCGQSMGSDMARYMDHTDKHVVDLIKYDHPNWVEKDGSCTKCYEYYRAELDGSVFGDAPCAIRLRFLKKLFRPIYKLFIKL